MKRRKTPDCCTPVMLSPEEQGRVPLFSPLDGPQRLALYLDRSWGKSAKLTVGFTEAVTAEFRDKILAYANLWGAANGGGDIEFVWTQTDPTIRITREMDGYWSYLGRDILGIARNRPTMCLQDFTAKTKESEWARVVPHEFGHSLGFPHEHARAEIVALLDASRTIDYFGRTQGWSAQEVRQQVLTPISARSIMGTPAADAESVMCYQLPASITKNGVAIRGGATINSRDLAFARMVAYPVSDAPPPPPTNGAFTVRLAMDVTVDPATKTVTFKAA